ncbi:hypothetical protein H2203_005141 [Taxawa tesnikishii (nom. ined.)]|nr:hypothetical protein H2203_005141 [Dothideales sp. JES 119]
MEDHRGFNRMFGKPSLQDLMKLDIHASWGSLYELCRFSSKEHSRWRLMFTFCAIAFGHGEDYDCHLRDLLACAFSREFSTIDPPRVYTHYDLSPGDSATRSDLGKIIMKHENKLFKRQATPPGHLNKRRKTEWRRANESTVNQALAQMRTEKSRLEDLVYSQWPTENIRTEYLGLQYLNETEARKECQASFHIWYQNRLFMEFIDRVEKSLSRTWCSYRVSTLPNEDTRPSPDTMAQLRVPSLEDLIEERPARSTAGVGISPPISEAAFDGTADSRSLKRDDTHSVRFAGLEEVVSRLSSSGDQTTISGRKQTGRSLQC